MRVDYNAWTKLLKDKYKVDHIYSYSQIETFINDSYEYYLKYVIKAEPDILIKSPYGLLGGLVHDILEKFYKNEIKRADCKDLFISQFSNIMSDKDTGTFSINPNDNERLADNFQRNLLDYFKRVDKIEGKVLCEEPISCVLDNDSARAVFCGYIDVLNFNKDKHINIIDYKTSGIYSSQADIADKIKQLVLYAIGVKQQYNVKYSDISIGWNFVKFAKVISTVDLSEEIVERKNLANFDLTNYVIKDCIIMYDVTDELVDTVTAQLLAQIKQIEDKVNEYNISNDDHVFWQDVTIKDMFRLSNFCQYSSKLHKPLYEYLKVGNR